MFSNSRIEAGLATELLQFKTAVSKTQLFNLRRLVSATVNIERCNYSAIRAATAVRTFLKSFML